MFFLILQNSCFSCYFKVLILIHLLISGKPCVIYIYNYIFIYIINIVTTLSKLELKNKSKSLCLCIIQVEITVVIYEIAELNPLRPSGPFKIEKNGIKWPFSADFLRLCTTPNIKHKKLIFLIFSYFSTRKWTLLQKCIMDVKHETTLTNLYYEIESLLTE